MKKIFWLLVLFVAQGCVTPRPVEERKPAAVTNPNNPGVAVIDPSPYSQLFAISDVHGMYGPLMTLLQAGKVVDQNGNWIAGNSLFIVVGDSIDKGPNSVEVLNFWIKLQAQAPQSGGRVVHLLGNHEAEFLASPTGDSKTQALVGELSTEHLPVSDLTGTTNPMGQMIHSEPVAARVGAWLFCHAGFYPDTPWAEFVSQAQQVLGQGDYANDFLQNDYSILEAKKWETDPSMVTPLLQRMTDNQIFGIVFGHQPGAFGIEGRSAAKDGGRLIKIDNGMPPEAGSHPGSLLVFRPAASAAMAMHEATVQRRKKSKPAKNHGRLEDNVMTAPVGDLTTMMNAMSYPHIEVIQPDGSVQTLMPE